MRKFGTTEEQMAAVSVKNHRNSSKNPLALFRNPITLEEVMNSRKISDPIKSLDSSFICTGSSALLLASKAKAKQLTDNPIWIRGIGQKTSGASLSLMLADDDVGLMTTREACRQAYDMSGIKPQDIDVVELHDAFTIMEIMAYEDLFLTPKGEGGKFVAQQQISTNPRGGLLGCGHPVGCTGVAQTAEIAAQLAGRAGRTQVKGCSTGLVHNMAVCWNFIISYYTEQVILKLISEQFLCNLRRSRFAIPYCIRCGLPVWPPIDQCYFCMSRVKLKKNKISCREFNRVYNRP